jgi:probable rRNA maturation factor
MVTAVAVSGTGALPSRDVQRAVAHVLEGERRAAHLSVAFVGPAEMRRLHREYKGVDRSTDVLAFALPQPDGSVAGDIYVCRHQAAIEARTRGVPLDEELLRLVIHGTLHVLGWDHPEEGDREQSPMWQRQERYLRALA